MEQDWRINGQEEYLKDAILYKVVFPAFWEKAYIEQNMFFQKISEYAQNHVAHFPDKKEYLEGEKIQLFWHEHCEFCWEKALTDKDCVFYCTEDMYYWICAECFRDFREKFNWKVKSAEELFR